MNQFSSPLLHHAPVFKPQRSNRISKIWRYLPCFKILILTAFCTLIWYMYGTAYLYRDPGGIFFNKQTAYDRKYSLYRENEALKFLRKHVYGRRAIHVQPEDQEVMKVGKKPSLCAVIASYGGLRGKETHPLELSLATLLSDLTPSERSDLDFRVFITNSNLTDHPLYTSPILSLADHVASPKDVAQPALIQKLSDLESDLTVKDSIFNKSVLDLSLAVQHCYLNSSAPYIAFFEDDIIAAEGWFTMLKAAIRDSNILAAKHNNRWLDLRLFNPIVELRWTANLNDFEKIMRFVGIIIGLVIVSETLWRFNQFVCRVTSKSASPKGFSDKTMRTFCILTLPLFTLMLFYSGKSIIPRHSGVSIQPWGCCTQSTVFPREEVPRLVMSIQNRSEKDELHAFDTAVKLYAAKLGMLRMVLDPPMIQHVGFKSVVNSNISRIFPWSPQFEDHDSQRLKQNHQRMVQELYRDI